MSNKIKKLFDEQGFVVIKKVLDKDQDLIPVLQDMEFITNRLIHKFVNKKNKSKILQYNLRKKYSYLKKINIPKLDQYFNIRMPQNDINKDSDFFATQSIWNLIKNKNILDNLSKILGSEISSHPSQNSRIKQPEKNISVKDLNDGLLGRTPWHQDAGVLNKKGQRGTDLITCWIPFTNTKKINGSMLAIKGSHKFGLVNHDRGSKGQVEVKNKEVLKKMNIFPLEANVGDIIFLNKYLIHCSGPNKSKNFRISLDLRYNKVGQPSGREPLPSFVVKSKNKNNIKIKNFKQWIALWEKAKEKCIPRKYTFKYPLPTFKSNKRDLAKLI